MSILTPLFKKSELLKSLIDSDILRTYKTRFNSSGAHCGICRGQAVLRKSEVAYRQFTQLLEAKLS